MTSPVVEAVRTIPLIVETGHCQNHIPMEIDADSGFPFDRDADRDGNLRSQLDDIAKRHPEFAEHLGNFSRRRQSSGGDAEDFHRRFERPFAGLERFGFPFDRDEDFDPEQYAQQFYQQQPEYQHPQPQSYQHQQPHNYQSQPDPQQNQQQSSPKQDTEIPSTSDCGRNNIQQSNTIDLGQKQEPVNERSQRSMSAPPTEKGQRFTSSIKIPVNQPSEGEENMAQTQQTDNKTTERIIPIHIEGRDEPVIPKNTSQPQQSYSAGPQPERIFGQRPEHFTQYVNREPRQYDKWHHPGFDQMHQGFGPDEMLRKQRYQQQNVPPFYQQQRGTPQPQQQHVPPQPQPQEDVTIPVQREPPQTKKQAPPPQQQTAPPQQPPQPKPATQQQKPNTPIEQIQVIQKDVLALMAQVEIFAGQPKDKHYLYLDEMLTRNLLKLDNIDTQGQDSIRSARKEAIKCIEKAISVLETKAAGNVAPQKIGEEMEVEEKPQQTTTEDTGVENDQTEAQTMETEAAVDAPSENILGEIQQVVEFSPENTTNPESEQKKEEEEQPSTEDSKDSKVIENRAVLVVTAENKDTAKSEVEQMEAKDESPAVVVEEPKPEGTEESNLPVSEAVKRFEGKEEEKKEESKPEENKEEVGQVQQEENKDDKKEEKKEKKKGKKKAEKKEK